MNLHFRDQLPMVVPNSITSFLSLKQGNQPFGKELRGDDATNEFVGRIAPNFPLLPTLDSVQEDLDQEVGINDHIAKWSITWN